MDIRYYLKSKGFKYQEKIRPGGPVAIMTCPFCKDKEKSFAVSLKDGAYNCLRLNNCGVKGSWYELQKMLGDKPVMIDNDKIFYSVSKKEYKKPEIRPDVLKQNGYKYFEDRKINKDTIKKFRIGQKGNDLMFPIFVNNEHVGTKFRSLTEKKFWNEKGSAPYLFNHDACNGQAIAICEGYEDCMSLDQYNIPAVSVPNGVGDETWIELEWEYLDKFEKIYMFFDNDKAGQDAVDKIVTRLGKWRCYNVLLPFKDANECLIKNVSQEEIKVCIENAAEYDLAILKKAEYYREKTKEFNRKKERKYGYTIGINKLNNILKGWREGELTIIHGHSGAGKSTWISQEILFQITNGYRICLCSLELPPPQLFSWMSNQYIGRNNLNDFDYDEFFNFIGDKLFLLNRIGEMGAEKIFDAFNFASRKYNIKFFVVDNMMMIRVDKRYEYYEQKNILEIGKTFAMDHQCHVFILTHPRKTQSDNMKPTKIDILGTSQIGNLCDNIVAIWRNKDDTIVDAELIVQKNRFYGKEESVEMFFNSKSKLFSEVQ